MPISEKFKYKSLFESTAQVVSPNNIEKNLAEASLDSLKPILPSDINIKDNPDLLYIVANGAVANLANKNSDVVLGSDVVKIAPLATNKYITIEHKRNNGAVGAILGSGFSKYGSNEIISSLEAQNLNTPFNWVVSGFIWEVLNPGLVNYLIECSEATSKNAFAASLSWELFFTDYQLLVGSTDISQGEIISDPIRISKLSQYLKSNGGDGTIKETKEPIYRLIVGDMLPGGFSITNSPAASVKGILPILDNEPTDAEELVVLQENQSSEQSNVRETIVIAPQTNKTDEITNVIDQQNNISVANIEEKSNKLEKIIEKSTISEKKCVNNNTDLNNQNNKKRNIYMVKFKNIKDITASKFESCGLASDQAALVADELNEFMDKFAQDLDKKNQEVVAKEDEIKNIKASLDKATKSVEEIQSKLEASEQARAAEKEKNDLTVRLNDLNTRFELSEKGVQAIAKQIKGLDEAKYTEWLEFAESTFAAKKDDDNDAASEDDSDEDDAMDAKNKKKKAAKASENTEDEDFDFNSIIAKKNQKVINTSAKERNLQEEINDAFKGWEKELSLASNE